jgi:hypothetical protein
VQPTYPDGGVPSALAVADERTAEGGDQNGAAGSGDDAGERVPGIPDVAGHGSDVARYRALVVGGRVALGVGTAPPMTPADVITWRIVVIGALLPVIREETRSSRSGGASGV